MTMIRMDSLMYSFLLLGSGFMLKVVGVLPSVPKGGLL